MSKTIIELHEFTGVFPESLMGQQGFDAVIGDMVLHINTPNGVETIGISDYVAKASDGGFYGISQEDVKNYNRAP